MIPPRTVPAPRLEIQKEPAPVSAPADASAIVVQRLAVTGASVYSESELMAIAGIVPGQRLTLGDLNAMADRVTNRYRQDGYLVGRAYLPAQEVKDGVVTMAVLEGTYGNV
ncbi:MAG: POTRA domain-containing protein, partial [Caulobacter sp.]|nr:POTRA domain-containing protein [Caulobacter sp.]